MTSNYDASNPSALVRSPRNKSTDMKNHRAQAMRCKLSSSEFVRFTKSEVVLQDHAVRSQREIIAIVVPSALRTTKQAQQFLTKVIDGFDSVVHFMSAGSAPTTRLRFESLSATEPKYCVSVGDTASQVFYYSELHSSCRGLTPRQTGELLGYCYQQTQGASLTTVEHARRAALEQLVLLGLNIR